MAKRRSRRPGKEAHPAPRIATQPSAPIQQGAGIVTPLSQGAAPSGPSRSFNSILPVLISVVSLLISSYSAFQATKSASAARDSATAATENIRVGQRAFLGVQKLTLGEVSEGQPASVEVQVENSGRTPAINMTIQSRLDYRDSALPENPDYGRSAGNDSVATVLPGASHRNIIFGERGILPADVQAFKDLKSKFYAYGLIRYEDVFGTRHTTRFCGWYNIAKKSFTFCDSHNEMK